MPSTASAYLSRLTSSMNHSSVSHQDETDDSPGRCVNKQKVMFQIKLSSPSRIVSRLLRRGPHKAQGDNSHKEPDDSELSRDVQQRSIKLSAKLHITRNKLSGTQSSPSTSVPPTTTPVHTTEVSSQGSSTESPQEHTNKSSMAIPKILTLPDEIITQILQQIYSDGFEGNHWNRDRTFLEAVIAFPTWIPILLDSCFLNDFGQKMTRYEEVWGYRQRVYLDEQSGLWRVTGEKWQPRGRKVLGWKCRNGESSYGDGDRDGSGDGKT